MRKRLKPWFQPVKLRIICETKNCFSIVLWMRQAKWHFRHSRWYVGKKNMKNITNCITDVCDNLAQKRNFMFFRALQVVEKRSDVV